ncbi:MAG: hypothetical protein EBX41_05365, partial [Chitinophagia bacterium]|nr:hypothetical protein [Chitinophagia bacterium]
MDSSRQLGLLYIFVGSGLGGVVRYGLAMGVRGVYNKPFPMGTFVVNVVACLLMGFLVGMADQKQLLSPAGRLFWT